MSRRRLVGLVLAATVGWLPVAPPEHVHAAEEHGHQHVLVHRHLTTHAFTHASLRHDGVVDDDDAPILTLDTVYAVPVTLTLLSAPRSAAAVFAEPPVANSSAGTLEYFERLIHGPPRAPTGLRAPPLASRL